MRHILERIESELKLLDRELRIELPKEIARATALGDLRENAEYHAALDRQRYVQARIAHLNQRRSQLSTVRLDQIPRDRAAFGSIVTVRDLDTDEELVFELVLGDDGDASQGRISVSSPIGRALLNRRPGEEVVAKVPAGERTLEVVALTTLHERPEEDGAQPAAGASGAAESMGPKGELDD
ncbi:MAG: transcription elongation factor GreA [Acidobacteria bacterium]|jgi:transcription elongation factor GreA|nr:transcription elongation factor GreA [Acidobacteriota bacterium]